MPAAGTLEMVIVRDRLSVIVCFLWFHCLEISSPPYSLKTICLNTRNHSTDPKIYTDHGINMLDVYESA